MSEHDQTNPEPEVPGRLTAPRKSEDKEAIEILRRLRREERALTNAIVAKTGRLLKYGGPSAVNNADSQTRWPRVRWRRTALQHRIPIVAPFAFWTPLT